ncbi:MAG: hypothetical protein HYV77_00485 [Candidatus Wildermuthbacteria bacterium]|nr:hypothetical protein [Candidatus Wildermuthbacteria bacterium]
MSFVGTTMDGQTVRARVESRSVRVLPKGVLTVSLSPTTPIARTILSGGSEDGLVLKLCASYEPIYIDQLIVKGTTAVAMVGPVSHGVVWRNAPSESLVEYYVLEVGVITPGECLTLSLAVRAREIDGDRVKAGDLVQAWVVENRIHALGVNSREWVDPNTPELRSAPHTVVPREE